MIHVKATKIDKLKAMNVTYMLRKGGTGLRVMVKSQMNTLHRRTKDPSAKRKLLLARLAWNECH